MDKKQKPKRRDSKASSRSKVFGASSLQIGGDDGVGVVSNSLIGSIVEKGISDNPPPPTAPPKLSVLPFPVARHRSHGPVISPFSSLLPTLCIHSVSLRRKKPMITDFKYNVKIVLHWMIADFKLRGKQINGLLYRIVENKWVLGIALFKILF